MRRPAVSPSPSPIAILLVCTLPAGGADIAIPAVTVNALEHSHQYDMSDNDTYTKDTVQFPCLADACSGPGFTASIGHNDTIIIRFEAPQGSRFEVLKSPVGLQEFSVNAYWQTGASDIASHFEEAVVTFENLQGTHPAPTYDLAYVSDNGEAVVIWLTYDVVGDFSFTAMQIEFALTNIVFDTPRTYGEVHSSASSSFGTGRYVSGAAADMTLMRIVETCPGDINDDDAVDVFDLLDLLGSWGSCGGAGGGAGCAADIAPENGDGVVNVFDLLALLGVWGPC